MPTKKKPARARRTPAPELSLNCDAIEMQSVDIDWREALDENGEGWIAYEAITCDTCNRVVLAVGTGGDQHECRELAPEVTETIDGEDVEVPNMCRGKVYTDGPAMNYWYPVRIRDCADAARKVAHLPLCVVEFADGRTGLALTGGGMDLSWEICEAFIALGYYPPINFELPAMGGRGKNGRNKDRDRAIIKAYQEACKIAARWAMAKHDRARAL